MDLEDLKSHVTDEVKPIFTNYKVGGIVQCFELGRACEPGFPSLE